MQTHAHIETIERYYRGCNTADVELMMSTFTDDVVHYFVDHEPVSSASGLASYWAKVAPRTHSQWTIDHAIANGDEAVIEWSMQWQPPDSDQPERLRGTEWFIFRNGRIAEIRSYHNNHRLHHPANRALRGFPYRERGYAEE